MKRAVLVLILIIVGCTTESTRQNSLISFIPSNSAVIIKINDFQRFKSDIKNSELIKEFSKTNAYKKFEKKLAPLKDFDPYKETLLTLTEVGKNNLEYTFITKNTVAMFTLDSAIIKKSKSRTYENKTIKTYGIEGEEIFTTLIDSTFLVSSSELLIVYYIRNFEKTQPDEEFQKLYNTSQINAIATLFIDNNKSDIYFDEVLSNKLLNSFKKFAQWSAVDISVDQ